MPNNELYLLKENKIFLPKNDWFEEREIAETTDSNQQNIIEFLIEKFEEIQKEVLGLEKEFEESNEKIKIAGKINRKKSHLLSAKAIGNYIPLFITLDKMEKIIESEVSENLNQKEILCIELEKLLDTNEWKQATEQLKILQKKYKELPSVPDLKSEEYKERFEKTIDEFFKKKQASFETFEQDLLDNLSKKMDLCEKAESLSNSKEWKKTTEMYQQLNEDWKAIGMVPKHRIEELWFRFSTAKDIFFIAKREHFEEIKGEQEENLIKKLAIISKAEALKDNTDWKKTSDSFAELMEEWKKTGRASNEKNDEVWNQFLEIKNHFYQLKDAHYSNIRMQLDDNHSRKMAIVTHAEELQHSSDWENATDDFMNMFEEWKKIGRVAKEHGDEAWERFMKAKRNFFDRKDANREERKKELSKDLQEKVSKNRSYFNKINKELMREEDLLLDVEDRIKNLPPTLRSYEKREEYLEMIEDIKEKVNQLQLKVNDAKEKMNKDERELNYILRGPKKNNHTVKNASPEIPENQTPQNENSKPAIEE